MTGLRKTPKKVPPLTWDHATVSCTTAGGWHFVMPITERTNAVWRQWKGRTLVSAKHRADKEEAPRRFRHVVPLGGYVAVTILWVRERRSGDTDGRIKATLDLLRGIAYPDDASVCDIRIIRVDDGLEPGRVEVVVSPTAAPTMALWHRLVLGEGVARAA